MHCSTRRRGDGGVAVAPPAASPTAALPVLAAPLCWRLRSTVVVVPRRRRSSPPQSGGPAAGAAPTPPSPPSLHSTFVFLCCHPPPCWRSRGYAHPKRRRQRQRALPQPPGAGGCPPLPLATQVAAVGGGRRHQRGAFHASQTAYRDWVCSTAVAAVAATVAVAAAANSATATAASTARAVEGEAKAAEHGGQRRSAAEPEGRDYSMVEREVPRQGSDVPKWWCWHSRGRGAGGSLSGTYSTVPARSACGVL